MINVDDMKKNLWLSKYTVWFIPCLAVSVISQAGNYTYDTTVLIQPALYTTSEGLSPGEPG